MSGIGHSLWLLSNRCRALMKSSFWKCIRNWLLLRLLPSSHDWPYWKLQQIQNDQVPSMLDLLPALFKVNDIRHKENVVIDGSTGAASIFVFQITYQQMLISLLHLGQNLKFYIQKLSQIPTLLAFLSVAIPNHSSQNCEFYSETSCSKHWLRDHQPSRTHNYKSHRADHLN